MVADQAPPTQVPPPLPGRYTPAHGLPHAPSPPPAPLGGPARPSPPPSSTTWRVTPVKPHFAVAYPTWRIRRDNASCEHSMVKAAAQNGWATRRAGGAHLQQTCRGGPDPPNVLERTCAHLPCPGCRRVAGGMTPAWDLRPPLRGAQFYPAHEEETHQEESPPTLEGAILPLQAPIRFRSHAAHWLSPRRQPPRRAPWPREAHRRTPVQDGGAAHRCRGPPQAHPWVGCQERVRSPRVWLRGCSPVAAADVRGGLSHRPLAGGARPHHARACLAPHRERLRAPHPARWNEILELVRVRAA
jgi:hypothetical protein